MSQSSSSAPVCPRRSFVVADRPQRTVVDTGPDLAQHSFSHRARVEALEEIVVEAGGFLPLSEIWADPQSQACFDCSGLCVRQDQGGCRTWVMADLALAATGGEVAEDFDCCLLAGFVMLAVASVVASDQRFAAEGAGS